MYYMVCDCIAVYLIVLFYVLCRISSDDIWLDDSIFSIIWKYNIFFKGVQAYSAVQYEILWYNILHYGIPTPDIKVYDVPWYNIWHYQYDVIPECILL